MYYIQLYYVLSGNVHKPIVVAKNKALFGINELLFKQNAKVLHKMKVSADT